MTIDSQTANINNADNLKRLLSIKEVCNILGISKSVIYDMVARRKFPAPVHILGSRTSRWILSEVDAWFNQRVTQERSA